jgi:hypothetical protein
MTCGYLKTQPNTPMQLPARSFGYGRSLHCEAGNIYERIGI